MTQIKDVIVPVEFTQYLTENTMAEHPLMLSGVISRNPVIGAGLRGASDSFTIPYWLDLDGEDEFGIANDDSNDKLVAGKISAKSLKVQKMLNTKGWSAMALASELSGSSAADRIKERATTYVSVQAENKLVAVLNGIYNQNKETGNSDMINDVTAAKTIMYTAANDIVIPDKCLNRKSLVDAISLMGMRQKDIKGMMVHIDIYNELVKQDQIKYLVPSAQDIGLATFMGIAITYSDKLPKDAATGVYTTIFFGTGAIAYDNAAPTNAAGVEVDWDAKAGNGSGEETLIIRQNSVFAPAGFSFTAANMAGVSPTLAELQDATNWKREYERKNSPICFLTHVSYEKAIEVAA